MRISLKAMLISFLLFGSAFTLATGPAGEAKEAAKSPTPEPKAMATPAQPGLFRLDHYKVYVIDRQEVEFKVGLRGQFDTDTRDAKLVLYSRHLNPVDKNNEGIIDKHAHLSWYDIRAEAEPVRKVVLRNQFGLQTIKIKDPVALLVPTHKIEQSSQFPDKLDHYKVYEVIYGEPVFKEVYLRDQFGDESNFAQKPVYFAVPVLKNTTIRCSLSLTTRTT